ncbi:hypothetical protein D3C85_1083560 [compost metagenome]
MADEQDGFLRAVAEQARLVRLGQGRAGHLLGQGVGLEHHVAVGLRVFGPELGTKHRTGEAVAAGQGHAARQRQVCATQQAVEHPCCEAGGIGRGLEEGLVDPSVRVHLAQRGNHFAVPAGMDHAEMAAVEEQRQFIEPAEEVAPVGRVVLELFQGFLDQPGMARRVLTDEVVAAARWRRGAPAEGVELVVAHDAAGLPGLDHGVHQVQRLADARAAVDDVAEEQRHALRVLPDVAPLAVTQAVE